MTTQEHMIDLRLANNNVITLTAWWRMTNECLRNFDLPEIGFAEARKAYAEGFCPAGYAEITAERLIESGAR